MPLPFFESADPKDSYDTHLVGEIDISYRELVSIFGEPHSNGHGYKVVAEIWFLQFNTPDGPVIATIYNYKSGKNYNGRSGQATSRIRGWHIGGKGPESLSLVRQAILITPRTKPAKRAK